MEILNRFNGAVIFEAEVGSIKELVESAIKEGISLRSADLRLANLRSADLRSADLRSADLQSADLRLANLRSADLWSADLRSANLRSADLWSADLRSADLRSANLRSANLRSIRNYYDSHDIFQELVKRTDNFSRGEWALIGEIIVLRPCWDQIIKFPKTPILSVLKKLGHLEYLNKYIEEKS